MNAYTFAKKTNWFFSIIILGALLLSACQPAPAAPIPVTGNTAPTAIPAAPTAVSSTATTTASEPTINVVKDAKLGDILVGNNGMTLYMYTKDTPDTSTCTGGCAKAWPPLVTLGSPVLGAGVDAKLVGSATMANGSKIVTYNHMPLYYWAKDKKAGDTTGQGVGSVWYVVSPDGKAVGAPAAAGSTSAPAAAVEATINVVKDAKLGDILVGNNGMTLYMYTKDTPDTSTCTGGCAKAWPPLVTLGSPVLGAGVDAKLVGSATMANGSKIVTYNHMPLYYWAKDVKAGDTTGQGVGSVWFVISPAGKPVGM